MDIEEIRAMLKAIEHSTNLFDVHGAPLEWNDCEERLAPMAAHPRYGVGCTHAADPKQAIIYYAVYVAHNQHLMLSYQNWYTLASVMDGAAIVQ